MEGNVLALGRLARIVSGYAFKSSDFVPVGYPVIKIADITPPIVKIDACSCVPSKTVAGLDRYRLRDRDILMAMTGAQTGKVGRLRTTQPAYLNQRVAKLSALAGPEFDDYIYAIVSQPGFDGVVMNNAVGSAQP